MTRPKTAGLCTAALWVLQAVWVTAAFAATGPGPEFSTENAKQTAIYKSTGGAVPEGYVVDRSLLSYVVTLPADFRTTLASLGPQDRWLDIGAGEGRAIVDYCTSKYDAMLQSPQPRKKKAKAVAISIEDRRTARWHEAASSLEQQQIQYLHGKRFREYSSNELGQFQVITDVLGGFSYAQNLSLFMEKALDALALNGTFYTVLQDVRAESGTNKPFYPDASFLTEIRRADGSELKICSWLKSMSCVEVTCEHKAQSTPPVEVYRIRKTCNEVAVPALVPTHFEAGTPPERRFELKQATPALLGQRTAR